MVAKAVVGALACYFVWSLFARKEELLGTLATPAYQAEYEDYKKRVKEGAKKVRFEDEEEEEEEPSPLPQKQLESIGLTMGDMYRLGYLKR